jgi:N-acetylglucosamine kinase-like BadF-type ATPase
VIGSLGAVVDRAREDGDPVAFDIMQQAADELALAAASVITRLDMRGEPFPILLSGGMLRESVWLSAEVRRRMAEVAPRAVVAPLTAEPAVGAVRLAIAEARGGVRVPPYLDGSRSTPSPSR